VVKNLWYFAIVDDVGGKLGRKGTLKETTVKVVPEDLIKDALVVGGIEGVVSVQGENQGKQKNAIAAPITIRNTDCFGILTTSLTIVYKC
jgi:hypothetical protein